VGGGGVDDAAAGADHELVRRAARTGDGAGRVAVAAGVAAGVDDGGVGPAALAGAGRVDGDVGRLAVAASGVGGGDAAVVHRVGGDGTAADPDDRVGCVAARAGHRGGVAACPAGA